MAILSYGLCAVTSIVCFALLFRGYLKNRTQTLLWSAFCFFFLAIQNGLLFIDVVLVPQISLSFWRTLAGFVGPAVLLSALILEKR